MVWIDCWLTRLILYGIRAKKVYRIGRRVAVVARCIRGRLCRNALLIGGKQLVQRTQIGFGGSTMMSVFTP